MLNDIGLYSGNKLSDDDIEKLKEFYKTNTIEETMKEFSVSRSTVKKYSDVKRFIFDNDDERRKANYQHVKNFRQKTKKRAVEYKGSKCLVCGYDKCISALEFHHLDPNKKDFGLSQNLSKAWSKIVEEIDKCVLICANCHREVHEGIIDIMAYTSPS